MQLEITPTDVKVALDEARELTRKLVPVSPTCAKIMQDAFVEVAERATQAAMVMLLTGSNTVVGPDLLKAIYES